ncbi:MAG TPA: thymidine kinase, partial [Actinobacteria bacterium]|nr:thymidine kinase [Actinomycetota bacterium]
MYRRGDRGWLEVICGPMFSGKSEELMRRMVRVRIGRIPVQIFKPGVDDRYSTTELVSHSSLKVEAMAVADSDQLLHEVEDKTE